MHHRGYVSELKDHYYSFLCPKCKAENWFCCGDPQNLCGRDLAPVFECFNCSHLWIDDEMWEDDFRVWYDVPEDMSIEEWMTSPLADVEQGEAKAPWK